MAPAPMQGACGPPSAGLSEPALPSAAAAAAGAARAVQPAPAGDPYASFSSAFGHLVTTLTRSPDESERVAAAAALEAALGEASGPLPAGDADAVAAAIEAACRDPYHEVVASAARAARAAARLLAPAAVAALAAALAHTLPGHRRRQVREEAACALGALGAHLKRGDVGALATVAVALAALAADPATCVRSAAAGAAGACGREAPWTGAAVTSVLLAGATDGDAAVAAAAASALGARLDACPPAWHAAPPCLKPAALLTGDRVRVVVRACLGAVSAAAVADARRVRLGPRAAPARVLWGLASALGDELDRRLVGDVVGALAALLGKRERRGRARREGVEAFTSAATAHLHPDTPCCIRRRRARRHARRRDGSPSARRSRGAVRVVAARAGGGRWWRCAPRVLPVRRWSVWRGQAVRR